MTTETQPLEHNETSTPAGIARWEGHAFGAIVLAAFLLYGIGSASSDEPIGLALVAINSIAVAAVGLIGFRLLRSSQPKVGFGYLAARIAEGILLIGGIVLIEFVEAPDAGDAMYLLGMIALGVGSVPFWRALGREGWVSEHLAMWGMVGYAALAAGAILELASGRDVAIVFAIPGGLFELAIGVLLLLRGFNEQGAGLSPQRA